MLLPLSFGLLAAFGFAVMFALAKGLGDNFSGQQLVFFRSLIALLIFLPFLFDLSRIVTIHFLAHIFLVTSSQGQYKFFSSEFLMTRHMAVVLKKPLMKKGIIKTERERSY